MPKRLTTKEFIQRAKAIHGDKYDYSKVEYINDSTKVCIICPEHGEFWQTPACHCRQKCGCPLCGLKTISLKTRMTIADFIAKAKSIHGDKYNYDKSIYNGSAGYLTITCPKHGDFRQTANTHLSGCGCPQCKADKTHLVKNKGTESFIEDARLVHGNKYDYSKVQYVDSKKKVEIICPKHGSFFQTPNTHLRGCGCPKCANEKTSERCRMTLKDFLKSAHEKHGNYYDYSLIREEDFKGGDTNVQIICPIHGAFFQKAKEHTNGRGCYWCGKRSMAQKQALTRNEVVERCNEVFGGKYDYSMFTKYNNRKDIIQVVCPIHGVWNVSVGNHLYRHSGCPSCKRSLGEERVSRFLVENDIEFIEQYRIKNENLFCENTIMMVDFYLPKQDTIIEYNGIQHYKNIPMFNGRTFEQQQERDNAVRQYCKEHKIKLIEIPYTEYDNIEEILKKELKKAV